MVFSGPCLPFHWMLEAQDVERLAHVRNAGVLACGRREGMSDVVARRFERHRGCGHASKPARPIHSQLK